MTTGGYRKIIESLVIGGLPFVPTTETPSTVQVERGAVLAERFLGGPREPLPPPCENVVDAAGHRRPVYRPLLIHALDRAGYDVEPWTRGLLTFGDVPFTAAEGATAAATMWSALAMGYTSPFRQLVESQQPSGQFLRTAGSDNPETHWFHELVILHAAADFAIDSGDPSVWSAVERATMYHLNETEPDHATGQPWGLPAFVRVAGAGPLADAVLHAVSAHQPRGANGVALLLLTDTLYGLEHATAWDATENESR